MNAQFGERLIFAFRPISSPRRCTDLAQDLWSGPKRGLHSCCTLDQQMFAPRRLGSAGRF